MKTNRKQRRGFTLVELLVVIVIIAALAALSAPMVIRQRKKADQTEAINNARQIGLALLEFETEYGSYPDRNTATDVTENTGTTLNFSGSNSNDFLRQLIGGNFVTAEKIFYAKVPGTKKPDDNFVGAKALEAGEVGFGYITNGENAFSTAGNSSRPILAAPLLDNGTDGRFDKDPFDGKAILLRVDNSATAVTIRTSDNTVNIGGGTNGLLATGTDSLWGTSSNPTLRVPQLRN